MIKNKNKNKGLHTYLDETLSTHTHIRTHERTRTNTITQTHAHIHTHSLSLSLSLSLCKLWHGTQTKQWINGWNLMNESDAFPCCLCAGKQTTDLGHTRPCLQTIVWANLLMIRKNKRAICNAICTVRADVTSERDQQMSLHWRSSHSMVRAAVGSGCTTTS